MKLETRQDKIKYVRESMLCVNVGVVAGLILYHVFLYFNIAIFGWNFGLIFAPLTAGYVETVMANRIIGENIGAISAFILFAYTTFYSFILNNPTLGFNLITFGVTIIILQAAFPTLINYILFTVGLGTLLYILGFFKKITRSAYMKIKVFVYKHILKKPLEIEPEKSFDFDEVKSNKLINGQKFIYLTSTDTVNRRAINVGQFSSTVIIEKATMPSPPDPIKFEKETLYNLKTGKDECLIKLVKKIRAAGGNGVLDLDIQYSLIGLGGDRYQVSAMGMGVYLAKR